MLTRACRLCFATWLLPAAFTVSAQTAPQPQAMTAPRSLSIAGQTGEIPVVQVNGRSYVDVEAIMRLLNAGSHMQGSRMVLSLPGKTNAVSGRGAANLTAAGGSTGTRATGQTPAGTGRSVPANGSAGTAAQTVGATGASGASAATVAVDNAAPKGLSRDFVTAGVGAVSALREWHAALAYAIAHSQPVTDELNAPLHRQSETQVALAQAQARTLDDRAAGSLISNELGNMRTLAANYQGMHDNATSIRTDALSDDALAAKVQDCLSALAGMSTGAAAQDVASCH